MNPLIRILRKLSILFRSGRFRRELDEEMAFHREQMEKELMAEGMSDGEAEEAVDTVDRDRAAFIDKYFHLQWPDRAIYHAMLNTAVGDEMVIQTMLRLKDHLK